MDYEVSNTIEDLDRRGTVSGVINNQTKELFQGFKYEAMNEIDG